MNDVNSKKYVKDKIAPRFYGHDKLHSKYLPKIPVSVEREYTRVTNAYMKIVKEALEEEIPNIKFIYKQEREEKIHNDSKEDLLNQINKIFESIQEKVNKKCEDFGIKKKLEGLASLTRKLSTREWKKAIKSTLGVDIKEEYYLGEFSKEVLESWIDENVSLINTLPKETLGRMKEIVYDGYTNGRTTTKMIEQIQSAYGTSKRHASLIARDQVAKLNSNIQKAQQQDAGITEYTWYTSGDSRVRNSHKRLNAKKFKWSDPPIVDAKTGRRCHPGEDYQCRCIARPVFSKDVNLPVDPKFKVTIKGVK